MEGGSGRRGDRGMRGRGEDGRKKWKRVAEEGGEERNCSSVLGSLGCRGAFEPFWKSYSTTIHFSLLHITIILYLLAAMDKFPLNSYSLLLGPSHSK